MKMSLFRPSHEHLLAVKFAETIFKDFSYDPGLTTLETTNSDVYINQRNHLLRWRTET